MSADTARAQGQLSFWRIVDVPFETFAAALDSWQRTGRGGQFQVGKNQLRGPEEPDRTTGTCRMQIGLARGPLRPHLRMRLDIDRWSAASTVGRDGPLRARPAHGGLLRRGPSLS